MYLTPNRRLALFLTEQGQNAFSFGAWSENLWREIQEDSHHCLLTLVEEWILWEKIIEEDNERWPLLRTSETAKLVSEAWHLCHQWKIPLEEVNTEEVWGREEHRLFLQWARRYSEICREQQWVDTAIFLDELPKIYKNRLSKFNSTNDKPSRNFPFIPKQIHCVGFGEWTPQQRNFLDFCRQQGSTVSEQSLLNEPGQTFQYKANTENEELYCAIHAAKDWLKIHPTAKIGILIPNLEQRRLEVERLLNQVFRQEEFNLAAPLSLAEYPMIRAAFLALQLGKKEISFEELSKVLRFSFFGDFKEEMNHRAQLDVLLRDEINQLGTLTTEIPLTTFIALLEQLQAKLPIVSTQPFSFVERLKACVQLQKLTSKKQNSEIWKGVFSQLLDSLQWPGVSNPKINNEMVVQLKETWDELLQQYLDMGRVLGKHSFTEAIMYLRRLAQSKTFSPLVSHGVSELKERNSLSAPIQVLGLLEGLGIPFDFLWVMGLHQKAWPPEPDPNPFIPFSLQRSLNLPRSYAERELSVAKRLTHQLCLGGKTVVFSFAHQIENEKTRLSPLLGDLKVFENDAIPSLRAAFSHEQSVVGSNGRHSFFPASKNTDEEQTSVPLKKSETIKGGSKILKLQAACPFRAFADIRLQAKPLSNINLGFSPGLRGELLHQCLLHFWRVLKNQHALKILTQEERSRRIEKIIYSVFSRYERGGLFLLTPKASQTYLALERRRLHHLIQRFVALELTRPPFEVIAQEVNYEVKLNTLVLSLRVDRIDRLENNDEILIDYKTGSIQLSDWFGERPLDPQLPLYCVARKTAVEGSCLQGVAFAIIRSDGVKFQGCSNNDLGIEGINIPEKMSRYAAESHWADQCSVWEQRLENLATEFVEGIVKVDPLEGESTCRKCHFKSLCRI